MHLENSVRACALAQLWFERDEASDAQSFVYLSVSDGVGVGIVINGELLRGRDYIAGEFGHMTLNVNGPQCMCNATGCWEAYTSNLATLSHYFGWNLSKRKSQACRNKKASEFTVLDLIARARSGDEKAIAALQATGHFLGIGLAGIVNVVNPDCIYLTGEITTAWDLIESSVREAHVRTHSDSSCGAHSTKSNFESGPSAVAGSRCANRCPDFCGAARGLDSTSAVSFQESIARVQDLSKTLKALRDETPYLSFSFNREILSARACSASMWL